MVDVIKEEGLAYHSLPAQRFTSFRRTGYFRPFFPARECRLAVSPTGVLPEAEPDLIIECGMYSGSFASSRFLASLV
jgi:hypothetical protein